MSAALDQARGTPMRCCAPRSGSESGAAVAAGRTGLADLDGNVLTVNGTSDALQDRGEGSHGGRGRTAEGERPKGWGTIMRRSPMPARVTPLPRGEGLQRTADVIMIRGGGKVLPFPKRPEDTIPENAWRLVNAILEDKRDRDAPKRAPLKAVSDKRKRENRQRTAMAEPALRRTTANGTVLVHRPRAAGSRADRPA